MINLDSLAQQIVEVHPIWAEVKKEMAKVIIGQKHLINQLLIALLTEGHLLLEGLPGLAKTLAITTFSKIIQAECRRIQFTPDLLPADLLGTSIYRPADGSFTINKGPIFTHILIADEINRAPAKVQSALLEVMQERQVTLAGQTFKLDPPYMVLATQNPIEHEGTYPLSEAQTDRFMLKVKIDYPNRDEEREILNRMAVTSQIPEVSPILSNKEIFEAQKIVRNIYIDDKVVDLILQIVFATRYPDKAQANIEGLLLYGASPRASIALKNAAKAHAFLAGRAFTTPQDVKRVAHDVLRHRLKPTYEAEAEDLSTDLIIDRIFESLAIP